ncbi:Uncharacterised protein [Candidatus Gugararchaeum adminiculabundum]|nr:Uncharacterised protein [Candidatus Gugararchaeum adminiculabundum]
MKERLLVLAKAAPEASQKYEELICVAGITDKGEWRRIYPIPWELFLKTSASRFRKKWWIEYELASDKPSDYRPESRKIKFETIKPVREASFKEIDALLSQRVQTLDEIGEKGVKIQSLGVVQPREVLDFLPSDNPHYEKLVTMGKQQDLFGQSAMKLNPPKFKYRYRFKDDAEGKIHENLCEDWEAVMLYINCERMRLAGRYPDEKTVHEKVRQKMLRDIFKQGKVYFIVGSHYRFPTFMIVGVVYPKKEDMKRG